MKEKGGTLNNIDYFESAKGSMESAFVNMMKRMKIVSYGVVLEVIDVQTVRVAETVRTGVSERSYFATVLTPSSTLFESVTAPQPGDLVLLLFPQKWNPAMFGLHREPLDAVVYDEKAEGYNSGAAVAVLLSPPKGHSSVTARFGGTPEAPEMTLAVLAEVYARFGKAVSAFFDGEDEAPISLLLGKSRPLLTDYRGTVRRRHGFIVDTVKKTLIKTDSAVAEEYSIYAPITRSIQGPQTLDVGLGTDPGGDPEGRPVETKAPITETVHGKSPVLKDIRSPLTVKVGLGNAESGSASEPRNAPVDVKLGEKSPITLSSASGMTLHFDKAVSIDGKETCDLDFIGKITVKGGAQITLEAGAKIFIGNDVQNIYDVLVGLVEQVKNLVTFGHPGIHKVTRASKTALDLYKTTYIDPVFTANK
jgi:hypothetical protein